MKNNRLSLLFILLFFVVLLQAKTIRYVKTDGTGDGSSWSNASSSIQTMIDNSVSGDEVWVAKGTYYPTTETIARDARSKTFLIKSGVNLYGGFVGNETTVSQRILADLDNNGKVDSCELANTTLLSGDIDGVADVWSRKINSNNTWSWNITGNSGNTYRVVTCSGSNTIDGFSILGGNNNSYGGGIYNAKIVSKCIVSNCNAYAYGGGIYATTVSNCKVADCSASTYTTGTGGGGIYATCVTNTIVTGCSVYGSDTGYGYGGGIYATTVSNCKVADCSAFKNGGAIFGTSLSKIINCNVSNSNSYLFGGGINADTVSNCIVYNCLTTNYGGGIYATTVSNCTIFNCSSYYHAGGISASTVFNSSVSNCSATKAAGGIASNSILNCAGSNNNTNGIVGTGVSSSGYISPDITIAYIRPTSFIGIATTEAQIAELLAADWHLKNGSPCINAGTSPNISSTIPTGTDLDNNPRVLHGTIDIGAYEYIMPTLNIPYTENFSNISDWNSSLMFYNSAQINGGQNIKWTISNQKADFTWQTNLTTTYSQPIFTYQIDGTKSSKVYLRYDMYYEAYAGTISILGSEKLNIEYSTDLVTWSTIATYSNANGTIANQTYKHDLSSQLAGKKFFIRFNANGVNSNRIEKWEIDNVIIDADGLSAVNTVQEDKYKYSVNNGVLNIAKLGQVATIQLYDINGKILASKVESQTANFSLLVHGVYFVKVTSDAGVENKKVVW